MSLLQDFLIENGAVYTRSDIAYKIVYKAFSTYIKKRASLINPINIFLFIFTPYLGKIINLKYWKKILVAPRLTLL